MSTPKPASPLPRCLSAAAHPSRRTFLRNGLTVVTGILGFGLAGCDSGGSGMNDEMEDPPSDGVDPRANGIFLDQDTLVIDLSIQTDLAESGGFLHLFSEDGREIDVVLINTGAQINAFSSICPHQNQAVRQRTSDGNLRCPTHGSVFDANTGARISGPANRGLERFDVTRTGDELRVQL